MLVLTASEMADVDRQTIEDIGIPGIVLMENAAQGAASFFLEMFPDLLKRRVAVLAGSGNNAGDGFAVARIFHNKGGSVRVFCLRPPDRLRGDALTNYQVLKNIGVPIAEWDEEQGFDRQWKEVSESDLIVDAILGTGLNSEVTGLFRMVIEAMNGLSVPILAIDVPSGLDAGAGKPLGIAVRATATATFGFPKVGHLVDPGSDYVGRLRVIDIGIPPKVAESSNARRYWVDEKFVSDWLKPRSPSIHKGRAGHVAVLSGSRGKTGAATLICQGAARVGAGLVTLFIPSSLNHILEVKLTEAMTLPIAETDDQTPSESALPEILEFLKGKQAFAMGPGIGLHAQTVALVKALVRKVPCPMVLDADALTALAEEPQFLRRASVPVIVTPHPGEMARLVHGTVQGVEESRLETASLFSREHGVTVVLKGRRTIISAPDGRTAINSTGNSAMASGGMGDALTGMIAGFLGQGFEPFRAACLGVYVHGLAADMRIGRIASRGLLASDVIDEIPRVIGSIEGFKGLSCSS